MEKMLLEKIRTLFKNKNYQLLNTYSFPYMTQSDFNFNIFQLDLKHFRKLFFYCPLYNGIFRQYSLYYHIFQNHFKNVNEYLNGKEIANCCAKMMAIEFKKIDNSLIIFRIINYF